MAWSPSSRKPSLTTSVDSWPGDVAPPAPSLMNEQTRSQKPRQAPQTSLHTPLLSGHRVTAGQESVGLFKKFLLFFLFTEGLVLATDPMPEPASPPYKLRNGKRHSRGGREGGVSQGPPRRTAPGFECWASSTHWDAEREKRVLGATETLVVEVTTRPPEGSAG